MQRQMKDSGIEWIGQIPESWHVVPFKKYLVKNDGGVWGDDPDGKNDIIVLRSTEQTVDGKWDIQCPAYRNLSNIANLQEYFIQCGDLLITKSSGSDLHIGKTTVADKYIESLHCVFSNFIQRLRVNDEMNPEYCWYILNSSIARSQFVYLQNSTSGIGNINSKNINEIKIPVLPLRIQKNIVNYLNNKCAQIDAIIAKQQQVIDKLKEYKLSTITETVTKGLDPNVPMKDSGVEWIGMVPEHWIIGKIKNFCNLKTGSTPSTSNPEWFDGTIQWFTPGDFAENYVLKDSTRTISQKAKDDMVAVIVPSNTVMIVGIGATAGKIGYTMVECSCNQQITAISTNRILPKYLMYWMIANTKFLRDTAMFTTLPILNNQTIGNYLVIFPDDKKEEKEAVDYLDSKCDKIEMLIEAKKQEIDRLCRYKKSIIYEIATGKMEV